MPQHPTQSELEAYLDEDLTTEEMVQIENDGLIFHKGFVKTTNSNHVKIISNHVKQIMSKYIKHFSNRV